MYAYATGRCSGQPWCAPRPCRVTDVSAGGALRLSVLVSSAGVLPVSIAVHGSLVYVTNAGPAGTNYTGFRLSPWGTLTPVPESTVALPGSVQPGDVLFNSAGTKLIGTRAGTSQIDSFTVGLSGRLRPAPGSPFAAQGLGPFGSQFRPANPGQLFVQLDGRPAAQWSRIRAGRDDDFGPMPDGWTACSYSLHSGPAATATK